MKIPRFPARRETKAAEFRIGHAPLDHVTHVLGIQRQIALIRAEMKTAEQRRVLGFR